MSDAFVYEPKSASACFVTVPDLDVAKKLSHGIVSNKLAACVNIIPSITSVYEWEGKINEDSELLLMIKTKSDKVNEQMVDNKNIKNEINKEMSNTGSEAEGLFNKFFRDVSKKSATKQILIGASSGWVTGYLTMKVGKIVAISVGGSIILLQIASNREYITIDWNKITKNGNKLSDKAQKVITGEGPSWAEKIKLYLKDNSYAATSFADRYIDQKLDQAERIARQKGKTAKKWYTNLVGDVDGPKCTEFHIFALSFVAGLAIGIGCA
ncbi:hypothetical protein PVAND_012927 [Polypedilum vanderplanki]|uniref:Uncharacterized protein n=1 Tax=Polypedilum vanderplanki TaxID=319348 RepID=A0A9J6CP33_POLVA|nr:hypothetical protein PVAND_012927 [Polypedilum vanderplanki]